MKERANITVDRIRSDGLSSVDGEDDMSTERKGGGAVDLKRPSDVSIVTDSARVSVLVHPITVNQTCQAHCRASFLCQARRMSDGSPFALDVGDFVRYVRLLFFVLSDGSHMCCILERSRKSLMTLLLTFVVYVLLFLIVLQYDDSVVASSVIWLDTEGDGGRRQTKHGGETSRVSSILGSYWRTFWPIPDSLWTLVVLRLVSCNFCLFDIFFPSRSFMDLSEDILIFGPLTTPLQISIILNSIECYSDFFRILSDIFLFFLFFFLTVPFFLLIILFRFWFIFVRTKAKKNRTRRTMKLSSPKEGWHVTVDKEKLSKTNTYHDDLIVKVTKLTVR